MKLYAIIVAGGSGTRMGTETPKQFLELAGKPVLMHTIDQFRNYCSEMEMITVLPENQIRFWIELQQKHFFNVPQTLVRGGSTRFYSVRNGLGFIEEPGLVAIHDGVRPFVSQDTIARCFETAEKQGNAIPVVAPADTLRIIKENKNEPLNRVNVRQVQTPQVFDTELLKKAYSQDYLPEFTDDATVVEKTGVKINLVEGNRENIKITTPEDLVFSQAILSLRH